MVIQLQSTDSALHLDDGERERVGHGVSGARLVIGSALRRAPAGMEANCEVMPVAMETVRAEFGSGGVVSAMTLAVWAVSRVYRTRHGV